MWIREFVLELEKGAQSWACSENSRGELDSSRIVKTIEKQSLRSMQTLGLDSSAWFNPFAALFSWFLTLQKASGLDWSLRLLSIELDPFTWSFGFLTLQRHNLLEVSDRGVSWWSSCLMLLVHDPEVRVKMAEWMVNVSLAIILFQLNSLVSQTLLSTLWRRSI